MLRRFADFLGKPIHKGWTRTAKGGLRGYFVVYIVVEAGIAWEATRRTLRELEVQDAADE